MTHKRDNAGKPPARPDHPIGKRGVGPVTDRKPDARLQELRRKVRLDAEIEDRTGMAREVAGSVEDLRRVVRLMSDEDGDVVSWACFVFSLAIKEGADISHVSQELKNAVAGPFMDSNIGILLPGLLYAAEKRGCTEAVIEILEHALSSENDYVRRSVAIKLAEIYLDKGRTAELTKLATHSDDEVSGIAAASLSEEGRSASA